MNTAESNINEKKTHRASDFQQNLPLSEKQVVRVVWNGGVEVKLYAVFCTDTIIKKRCLGSEQIVDRTVTSGVTNLEAAVAFDTSALWISHFSGSKGNQKWSTAVPAVLALLPSAFVIENMVSPVFLHLTKFRWLGLGQRKFPFCKEYKKLPSVSMGNFQWVMIELVRKMEEWALLTFLPKSCVRVWGNPLKNPTDFCSTLAWFTVARLGHCFSCKSEEFEFFGSVEKEILLESIYLLWSNWSK